jgi:MFS transporter, FSR family, fosmidomycin resistance protein
MLATSLARSCHAKAAVWGALHAVVDAACVMAVWRTGSSSAVPAMTAFAVVFGYDLLAFAGQVPLGALADRLKASRAAVMGGLALSTASLLLVPYSALATMIAAGLGNALFHLGAGASVLRSSGGRAAPAGIFVAPGALGLGLGMWMGKTGEGPAWPLVAALVLALPLVDLIHVREESRTPFAAPALAKPGWRLALALLFFSVVVRSFVGFGACRDCPKGVLVLVGLPLAAFAGKLCGGLISDRLGWIETSVAALLFSGPLIAFNGGNPVVALAGLLLFQMTMPVTLVAVYRLLPDRPALAFGLPCLALVAGASPTFFPEGRALFGEATFMVLVIASAISIAIALRISGVSWRVGLGRHFIVRRRTASALEGGQT